MKAAHKHIASVITQNGGDINGGENQGPIANVWVICQGGLHVFVVYYWHTEGWTHRNEALMEAV